MCILPMYIHCINVVTYRQILQKGEFSMTVPKYDQRAVNNYKRRNYKRILFEMRFEQYDQLKAVCDSIGEPVNTFIRAAVMDRLQKVAEEQQKLAGLGFSMAEQAERPE